MRAEAQDTQIAPVVLDAAARRRWARRLGNIVLRALVVGYFIAGAAFLVLRHAVLPETAQWREDMARHASAALGVPVTIGALEADWAGLRPRLHLRQVVLSDDRGAEALSLDRVDATLAWSSLLSLTPTFHRLEVHAPALQLARAADGRVSVAGMVLSGEGDGQALDWLLAQGQIVILGASVTWTDALRAAPPLTLSEVNLRIVRRFGHHLAGLTARGPQALARAIDLRADLRIAEGDPPAQWSGRLFAEVSGGVLEALAPWVDLPGTLSGRGNAALWATLGVGRLTGARATLDLYDARVQLGDELPPLVLRRLSGQVAGSRLASHLMLSTRDLTLETADQVTLAPTDLTLDIKGEGAAKQGRIELNTLDLAHISALVAHLPLAEGARARLAGLAPVGRFRDLLWSWSGPHDAPTHWQVRAGFDGIGLLPSEGLPGLAGLSGSVDGSDAGGRYRLDSTDLSLSLPGIFELPMGFATLRAQGGWQRREGRWQIDLDSAAFANADTHGEVSGWFRPDPAGAGEIDLQARLIESDGSAVWRYMPLVVNAETRDWLKRGIVQGRAHDARLRLRGNLDDFPFADGGGIFLITTRASDVTLDYAPGWPRIDGVDAALRFEGEGMQIQASRGTLSGVTLHDVQVAIPVLDSEDAQMRITGSARGATGDFLRFVSDSPVRARINGFTDDMRAVGDGELALSLTMPLHHVVDSEVEGDFRFADNRLSLVAGLPPIEHAAGQLRFSVDELSIPQASGQLLGAPLRLTAR
ncbi:MAG: TIGR02099 family protein, partial [Rhodocyclaceae bacterium]|nr:TIGR02099 family protein [Rhodocyclaceae bacterium]